MYRFEPIAMLFFLGLPPCAVACSTAHPGVRAAGDDGAATSEPPVPDAAPLSDASPSSSTEPEAASPAAPYTQTLLQNAHIGSDSSKPDFQQASADVTLASGPFASVNLVADLTSPCFPWSNWQSDPPPAGQNWPADCDAFDRNFELSLADPSAPGGPSVELVRAITPFGGPEHIAQDVTDVFNAVQGARTFRVTITAYPDPAGIVSGSKGGWFVSAHLEVTPGSPPRKVLAVTPIFYDSVTTKRTVADIPFSVPAGTTSAKLEYRVTGHGGALTDAGGVYPSCIGPAEEFCRRTHHVFVDGQEVATVQPWRGTCDQLCDLVDGGPFGQYCALNPCGAPSSVQASRANWCPGSVTPPVVFTPSGLATPGPHAFRFAIDNEVQSGQWRVSAVVFAYGD